jgi:hypothetical protein
MDIRRQPRRRFSKQLVLTQALHLDLGDGPRAG